MFSYSMYSMQKKLLAFHEQLKYNNSTGFLTYLLINVND